MIFNRTYYISCVPNDILMNSRTNTKSGSTAISVLIPNDDYHKLQLVARSERASISTIVRRYVGEGIDREAEA